MGRRHRPQCMAAVRRSHCSRLKGWAEGVGLLTVLLASTTRAQVSSMRIDIRQPLYALKLLASALAPVLAALSSVSALVGLLVRSPVALLSGLLGAVISLRHVVQIMSATRMQVADHGQRDTAPNERAEPWQENARLRARLWRLGSRPPRPCVTRDVAYWTLVSQRRALLCDLWQPSPEIEASGLGIIYLHGGSWQSLDKGMGTGLLFRRLTAQGHFVMDVAYRLCHETDLYGMLADVKRAIVWLKKRGPAMGVRADRVVLMGASAGGHLALLGAYAPNHPELEPLEMRGADTTVRGVVSYYGLPDLRRLGLEWQGASSGMLVALNCRLGLVGPEGHYDPPDLAKRLLGGLATDRREVAALMSPITHVGAHCPPTLLLQGAHDHITSVSDVRTLHAALHRQGATSVLLELPEADHAFNVVAPGLSPAARKAQRELERFLARLS